MRRFLERFQKTFHVKKRRFSCFGIYYKIRNNKTWNLRYSVVNLDSDKSKYCEMDLKSNQRTITLKYGNRYLIIRFVKNPFLCGFDCSEGIQIITPRYTTVPNSTYINISQTYTQKALATETSCAIWTVLRQG